MDSTPMFGKLTVKKLLISVALLGLVSAVICVFSARQKAQLDRQHFDIFPPSENSDGTYDGRGDLLLPLDRFTSDVGKAVRRLVHKNNLSGDELRALDFSWPGNPGYGDNPSMEVFNPAGGDGRVPAAPEHAEQASHFTYSFDYKLEGAGTSDTELTAFLADVPEDTCNSAQLNYGNIRGRQGPLIPLLETLPLSHTKREDAAMLPFKRGCVRGADNKFYYFKVILLR